MTPLPDDGSRRDERPDDALQDARQLFRSGDGDEPPTVTPAPRQGRDTVDAVVAVSLGAALLAGAGLVILAIASVVVPFLLFIPLAFG